MDTKRKEWDELSQDERNCLMWPDFLQWGGIQNIEVSRENPSSSLGLVTTVAQDPETKTFYHIAKRIKDNHPAHGHVKSFQWICDVDGKPTTEKKEIRHLICNGHNVVRLSLRTAVDPLRSVKTWNMAEKVVRVDIKEKKCGFELVHFYCKEENGNVKDRILIWDVNPPPESRQQLFRGDELLAVNGEAVEGKKLAQIYKLIFTRIPSVELKIKEMQRDERCQVSKTPYVPVDPSAPPMDKVVKSPDLRVTPKNEMQRDSESENTAENEERASSERPPERPETSSNSHKDTNDLIPAPQQETGNGGSNRRRWSFGGSREKKKVLRQSSTSENRGYVATPEGTPQASRKTNPNTSDPSTSTSTDKMCSTCTKMGEARLPDDRNKWRMNKIEIACYRKMCTLLDLDERSKVKLLDALECFDQTEASSIKLKFSNTGGVGIAKHALDIWGNCHRTHNVGALKVIVKDKMKRQDVIDEIEKWEKMNVCHGCGVKLKENN